MIRPCYLIVDPQHGGAISTRKLVLETAKLNVVTAYSGEEAVETLRKFPNLDGVVVDAMVKDMPCEELLRSLKALAPQLPVFIVGSPQAPPCGGGDVYLDSFDPVKLLQQIKERQRAVVAAIEAEDAQLSSEGK